MVMIEALYFLNSQIIIRLQVAAKMANNVPKIPIVCSLSSRVDMQPTKVICPVPCHKNNATFANCSAEKTQKAEETANNGVQCKSDVCGGPGLFQTKSSDRIDKFEDLTDKAKRLFEIYSKSLREEGLIKVQICRVEKDKQQMKARLEELSCLDQKSQGQQNLSSLHTDKIVHKKVRRNSSQIPRYYNCPLQKCGKLYANQASLAQHMKTKHSEFINKSEYQSIKVNNIDDAGNTDAKPSNS